MADALSPLSHRSSGGPRNSARRSGSFAVRASESVRQSIASAVSLVGDRIEQGTILGTTLNTICTVIGCGVLSLPLAMYNASISLGVLLSLLSSMVTVFGVYCIVRGSELTEKFSLPEILSYSLIPPVSRADYVFSSKHEKPIDGEGAIAEPMDEDELIEEYKVWEERRSRRRQIINLYAIFVICSYLYGTLIVFARVVTDSMPPVVLDFLHGHGVWVEGWFWLLIASVFFFAFTCVRTLEELKWTSLVGFATILYIVVIVFIRFFTNIYDPMFPKHKYPKEHKLSKEVDWFVVDITLFKCTASLALAYAYHYNAPLLYRELQNRNPKRMMFTAALAFPIITTMYLVNGIFGYLTFGALVASEHAGGDITKNFPVDDALANVGRLGLFFHFACVYPIQAVTVRRSVHYLALQVRKLVKPSKEIDDEQKKLLGSVDKNRLTSSDSLADQEGQDKFILTQSLWSIVLEAFLIVATGSTLAYFIPGIGIVINIAGALCGVQIVMVFPGLIGMSTFSGYREQITTREGKFHTSFTDRGKLWYACLCVVLVGICLLFIGVYAVFSKNRGE